MIVCNFNLSSAQIQVLLAFRGQGDTRNAAHHGLMEVDHTVSTLRKLCRDCYLEWMPGDPATKTPPGYRITPKGEMMLRVIEDELNRSLAWFDGASLPHSMVGGGESAEAVGKAEMTRKGNYRTKKRA